MKKFIIPLFFVLFTLTLIGCTNSNVYNTSTISSSTQTTLTEKSIETTAVIPDGDFRKVNFGMTREDVIKFEGKDFTYDENNTLAYQGKTLLNLECMVAYYFNDKKFFRGAYAFQNEHTNKTDYITDYNNIKEELTKKYGNPSKDIVNWKNDLFKDDPSQWGLAITTGDLDYLSLWTVNDKEILLLLNGDNYKISFILSYTNTAMAKNIKEDTSGL